MFPLLSVLVFNVLQLQHIISAQSTPKCVPNGLCFPQPIDVNPRIVIPGASANSTEGCKPGEELCYPSQNPIVCGTRYATVSGDPNADGPTSKGAHPWQVYMMNEVPAHIGSGVLIAPNIVLTAAHKVYTNQGTPGNIRIYTGLNNPTTVPPPSPPAFISQATRIVVHEDFKLNGTNQPLDYKNDIALVLLGTPQLIGYRIDVGIGCLPKATDTFADNPNFSRCIVGGWGESSFRAKDFGITHKQVTVPVVPMATCLKSMLQVIGSDGTAKYLDENNELCAGGEAEKDACTQDGGAPLMCSDATQGGRYVIAGLVIWGKGCAQKGVYGVYVAVAKYMPWIESMLDELLLAQ